MGGVMSAPVKLAQSLGVVSQSKPASAPAPTTAEVSQSSATSATEVVKKRRRGKSPTILTTATGAEGTPTLGATSLLGQ